MSVAKPPRRACPVTMPVVQLVGWGIDVGRRRGQAWPAALLTGLVNGAFGVVIIILEVLLH